MVVVSQPHNKIISEGKNAKYVKDCTELFLGKEGIEKLRGFESFVNLEVLWLNGNKLQYINNLEQNFRIRVLYAQDNRICSLKGSLECFKFLETLDLSNNVLRDLDKILRHLKQFNFLKNLNLKGNPCCEESDYRLCVIYHLPQLNVLDQHVITALERSKAKGLIGGDVATLTVAFGKRAPPPAPPIEALERSLLEQDLAKEASAAREKRLLEEYAAERKMFEKDPHPPTVPGPKLPEPPGLVKCKENFALQQKQAEGTSLAARLGNTNCSGSGSGTGQRAGTDKGVKADVYTSYTVAGKTGGTTGSSSQLAASGKQLTAKGGRALASIRQEPDWQLTSSVVTLP